MDASAPVDSTVFMEKCALRKYLADSGPTDVVNPGCRQYTLRHGKVLVEAIAAGIEPLAFRGKVESEMIFNLVVHDPDALINIIGHQRRDQAVIEADDAARGQSATQRDPRSVAAAGTKLQDIAADKHDGSQRTKTAGATAERNRRHENNACFVCGKQGHKQWDGLQRQQGKTEKGVNGQSENPSSSSSSNSSSRRAVPLSIPGAKSTGWPLRLPPLRMELVGTTPPQKRWLREPNLLRPRRLRRRMTTTCTFSRAGGEGATSGYRAHRDGAAPFSQSA